MHDLKYRHHNDPNMLWIHNTHKHDNVHNQHKVNIINIIYFKYFCYTWTPHNKYNWHNNHNLHNKIMHSSKSLPNFHCVTYGLLLMCLSFYTSFCVLGSSGECLMNYEDIMCIRYIPNIHNMHALKYRHHNDPYMLWIHNAHKHDNIHNQHKVNIINMIYIKCFTVHKLHIMNLIDIIIIICIIKLCIPWKN